MNVDVRIVTITGVCDVVGGLPAFAGDRESFHVAVSVAIIIQKIDAAANVGRIIDIAIAVVVDVIANFFSRRVDRYHGVVTVVAVRDETGFQNTCTDFAIRITEAIAIDVGVGQESVQRAFEVVAITVFVDGNQFSGRQFRVIVPRFLRHQEIHPLGCHHSRPRLR